MTKSPEPQLVTMKEFRKNFAQLAKPVRVIRARGKIEILGTWIPAGDDEREQTARIP